MTVGKVRVKIYGRQRPTLNGQCRSVFELPDYTTGTCRLRDFSDHSEARHEAGRIARQLSTGEATAAAISNAQAASYSRERSDRLKPIELARSCKPKPRGMGKLAVLIAAELDIRGRIGNFEVKEFKAIMRLDQEDIEDPEGT